jgi:hypothetical protein
MRAGGAGYMFRHTAASIGYSCNKAHTKRVRRILQPAMTLRRILMYLHFCRIGRVRILCAYVWTCLRKVEIQEAMVCMTCIMRCMCDWLSNTSSSSLHAYEEAEYSKSYRYDVTCSIPTTPSICSSSLSSLPFGGSMFHRI